MLGTPVNNTGPITAPPVLPIQLLCGQIYLITGEGQGLVLFSTEHTKFHIVGLFGGQGRERRQGGQHGERTGQTQRRESGAIAEARGGGGGAGCHGKGAAWAAGWRA